MIELPVTWRYREGVMIPNVFQIITLELFDYAVRGCVVLSYLFL